MGSRQSRARSGVAVTEKMCAVNKKITTKRIKTAFYRKPLLLAVREGLCCVNVNSGCSLGRDLQILRILGAAVDGGLEERGCPNCSCESKLPSRPM